jgi:hypothetical protein
MKRKILFFAFLLVAAIAGTSSAAFSLEIRGDRKTAPNALFAGVVANFFGVDSKVVLDLERDLTPIQVIGSLYSAGDDDAYLPDRARDFKRGHGWDRFDRGRKNHWYPKRGRIPTTSSQERRIFIRFLHDCYRVPERDVTIWLGYGMSYDEIIVCVNFAQRAKLTPQRVVELRRGGRDWSWLCRTWKVSEKDLGSLPRFHKYHYGRKIRIRR